ncbi:MAG: DUF2281 domain-containing protein [Xenococcaceae cyanobacterium]
MPEETQSLLVDFIQSLKKRYSKSTEQDSEKNLYEKFEESGLIGSIEAEEDLSVKYKQVLEERLAQKYDHS